ncbi:prepilin-type N-terminal cleavage/methylation domain-containing protein [Myxococcota bacterium]|nr:prepilin-type N-terminal cleavage/methylation domain-containing protein [Myxococcota bacterium]MBU1429461.1 prepilin-type N-terminal cleavage/methylation domain-containing protein [Myxococcota bacterium]MBU1897480.1 prepilin-type N-terminal cleavage/methylation domain-containing protein [Myxococcota bacterium]
MRRNFNHGFTLIEVMVALVLLTTLGAALLRSLSLSMTTKDRVSRLNDRYHEGRQVSIRISRELRQAILFAEVPEAMREEDPAILTRFVGEEDEIYFATTAHLRLQAEAKESDQAEVAYFLKSGDNKEFKGKTLYRRESRRLDDRPDKGGMIWPVVEGVKVFKLEYWDDSKEIGDDAWQGTWSSEENDLLPARVRMTLELESPLGGKPIRFVTQAAPRIRRPINIIDSYVQPKTVQGQVRQLQEKTETPKQ